VGTLSKRSLAESREETRDEQSRVAGYLARLLTDLVPQNRIRSYGVRFAAMTPVHTEPICTATVIAIEEVGGERRASLALVASLADGTTTLTGDALVAL
jgi:hypothetical protein